MVFIGDNCSPVVLRSSYLLVQQIIKCAQNIYLQLFCQLHPQIVDGKGIKKKVYIYIFCIPLFNHPELLHSFPFSRGMRGGGTQK